MNQMESITDRLMAKADVDERTGCWNWTGGSNGHGYGRAWANGRMVSAHRLSFELHCGQIPDGLHVLHSCDNRACINPAHLFLGTHAENIADRNAKGRQARGSANGRAKITEADVIAIRAATGVVQRELATQYGICRQKISDIRAGKRWS
ncbi:HNH endonuclease [Bradyrhizobium sp. Leo121]|nr:HNH endonuclease [Bradyrhizobium sp. Leo121]